ncbi:GGDEF domain-containing protein [Maribrevibacterium harenarium]|uniref:GGDEF domain-containing protein n=1 Tax=Maribrevibacterium harenarium TaxID=2589817 RepID=A0A501WGJ8_9GAMM|nr:bifunctional diguanylate cyclase/phosphodiesterase [Maribrevibacterium harenarium]TPE48709.1 GGDEF domain-containing protein [Maribrevibacterium harenarium]
MFLSTLYVAEGYESGKETIRAMELKQLHDITFFVLDELENKLDEAMLGTKPISEGLSEADLLDALYHFEMPLMVVVSDSTGSVAASQKIDVTILSEMRSVLTNNTFLEKELGGHDHDTLSSSNYDLDQYFYNFAGTKYCIMFHDVALENGHKIRIFMVKESQSDNYVVDKVFTRLMISSTIVVWIAIWGAVAVAFFLWKRIESSNRRVITAANTDSQTGLLNERALREKFDSQQANFANREHIIYAAKFRNLSQILANNSSLIVSKTLHQLATQLRQNIDKSCLLARLNDGTFVIVAPYRKKDCIDTFHKLINEPQQVDNFQFSLDPTVVEVIFPNDVNRFDRLISSISTLIFSANQQRLPFLRYSRDLIKVSQKALQYSAEIRDAIEQHQFELYLQPKVDMRTGATVGAEALIRWNHPEDGLLTPYHFLDIVEQSNVRSQFARFVANEAAKLAKDLHSKGHHLPVSFNLNGYDVFDTEVTTTLEQIAVSLPATNYPMLEIELTESETSIDVKHIAEKLEYISSLGYSIALDDFGTGMSSFSFSHTLHINTIKIDRSFVIQLSDDERSYIPIKTIVYLANNYGYHIVVEGVETKEQAETLIKLGCHHCQGYFYAKPSTYSEFLERLV